MKKSRPTQEEIDKLADIIWWIKGAQECGSDYSRCSLDEGHIEALRKARFFLMEDEPCEQ